MTNDIESLHSTRLSEFKDPNASNSNTSWPQSTNWFLEFFISGGRY